MHWTRKKILQEFFEPQGIPVHRVTCHRDGSITVMRLLPDVGPGVEQQLVDQLKEVFGHWGIKVKQSRYSSHKAGPLCSFAEVNFQLGKRRKVH